MKRTVMIRGRFVALARSASVSASSAPDVSRAFAEEWVRLRLLLVCLVGAAFLVGPGDAAATAGRTGLPNGRIAFVRGDDIYTVRADRSGLRRLTHKTKMDGEDANYFPRWSSDGRTLLFESGLRGAAQVFRIWRAGAGGIRTLPIDAAYSFDPSWSPDDRRLVYVEFDMGEGTLRMLIVGLDGQGRRQLTHHGSWERDVSPAWSPSGSLVCFERYSLTRGGGHHSVIRHELYLVRPDGKGIRSLTLGRSPDWSPDGQSLVFVSEGDLYVVGRDGSGRRRLSRTRVSEAHPSWSPDGKKIAFTRARSLWVHDLASGREQRVVGEVDYASNIDWQPVPRK
jgi:Tol biopolymer transport system component